MELVFRLDVLRFVQINRETVELSQRKGIKILMKRAGLIGGMSWESTVPYYKIMNEVIGQRLGGLNSADCILHSINFYEIESTISKGNWDRSNELLSDAAESLEKAGVDFISICSNTMHKCIPAMQTRVNLPIIHIVDATAEEMKKMGISEGLLLGTRFTMEESFNKERFHKNGIDIIIPDLEERQIVHNIIFEELCRGIITEESKEAYKKIIYKYCKGKKNGVILGCTEIGLLIQQDFMDVPVFDTTQIHAKKIALYMIE